MEHGRSVHSNGSEIEYTFVARFTIRGQRNSNDALVDDNFDATAGMATWLEAVLPDAEDVIVWSGPEDFVHDIIDEKKSAPRTKRSLAQACESGWQAIRAAVVGIGKTLKNSFQ